MKTSRIIIATFAAALSLVSCTKENADQKNSSSTSEPRVFTLEFSKQTRTKLGSNGFTPEWTGGETIKLSNGTDEPQDVTVTLSGDVATITTTLKGALTAVYPSTAAKVEGKSITDISVPATQHGTFAESNICMATNIAENATSIIFENKTAVLCFYVDDESIGVSKIEIEGTGVATDQNKITVTPLSPNTTLYKVGGGPDPRICYAAVLPVSGKKIKLTGTATSQTQPRTIPSATLEASKIYNAFIPYYIEVEGVKWGYCNVGAFLPEEYGEYFAWGETTGHEANDAKTAFAGNYSFSWSHAPFNGGKSSYDADAFNNLKDTVCPDGTLAPFYDAAYVNWGEEWRMPTKGEFDDLISKTSTSTSNFSDGILKINGHPSLIFPAAGLGDGAELDSAGSFGGYWSSSLRTGNPYYAYYLSFNSDDVSTDYGYRYYGMSVRPVSVSN